MGGSAIDATTRRAALVATAVTVPLVLVAALLIGGGSDDPGSPTSAVPPPVTVSAPPAQAATLKPCTAVLQVLPERLAGLAPRVVHSTPSSSFVVAWGDPAVVLRCGVARPASLKPGDSEQLFQVNGVAFAQQASGDATVYTAVDRAAYVEVSVPSTFAGGPLAPLAAAIGKALPAVCQAQALPGGRLVPQRELCAYRK